MGPVADSSTDGSVESGQGDSGSAGGTSSGGTSSGATGSGGTSSGDTGSGGTGSGDASTDSGPVPPDCGDGVVDYDLGETCDDGNNTGGDRCDAYCQREPISSCGDSALDIAQGEQCEDGSQCSDGNTDCTGNPSACSALSDTSCLPRSGDGCSDACQFETVGANCGDGPPDPGELCEDSNVTNGDGCNPTCNLYGDTTTFSDFGGKGVLTTDGTHLYASIENTYIDQNTPPIQHPEIIRFNIAACNAQRLANPQAGAFDACDDPTAAGSPVQCTLSETRACVLGNTFTGNGTETLATDGNRLWYFDRGAYTLREIDLTTNAFTDTLVAGSGSQASCANSGPDGTGTAASFDDQRAAVWFNGYVYMVDGSLNLLRRFDPSNQEVVTLAGTCGSSATISTDGFGLSALLGSPRYIASDNSGNIFMADNQGRRIRTYSTASTYVGTLAGGVVGYLDDAVGTTAQLERPRGLTSDGTSVYWGEQTSYTIRQAELASTSVSTLAGERNCVGPQDGIGGTATAGACGASTLARFTTPFGLAFDYPSQSLYVIESGRISRIQ